MSALIALVRREYIEHRAAFVIAPSILLAIGLLAAIYGSVASRTRWEVIAEAPTVLRFYEIVFAFAAYGWSVYLLAMLAFYFSNAFSADSRSNSMLFWKSMPQSDFKILAAKIVAGLTVFPFAIAVAIALSGAIAYLPAMAAGNVLPGYGPPDPVQALGAWGRIMLVVIAHIPVGLLWYLPFFAWIGMLSTVFGRWSIPLAIVIPLVIGLIEFMVTGGRGPHGGYVLSFLGDRLEFNIEILEPEALWLLGQPFDPIALIVRMMSEVNWISLAGGIAVAVIMLYLASEYRRRYVLT